MAAIVLEGETLGQKRWHFNKLVNEAFKVNDASELEDIDYEDSDVNNLFKIDLASRRRNVEYILKVLKCEDILYVSRAIKQSTWLITDASYAHIINPKYLHSELFPHMTNRAKNKFMLQIRLFLKDEKRVEEFFNFLKIHADLKPALKWLPNCSISFIEDIVKSNALDMTVPLVKRLCEKSATILDIYCRYNQCYRICPFLKRTTFLLKNDTDKYLNILENNDCSFDFGPRATKRVMKKCPARILEKIELYVNNIDIKVFANHFKKEEIQGFILKNIDNPNLSLLFSFVNVQHFLKRLPTDIRFDFVKQIFIDKTNENQETNKVAYNCARRSQTSANIYQWYKFAPFNVAMTDLKKVIRIESNPMERVEIFTIILNAAGRNLENIQKLIQFYRQNHINESFKFKLQFVNKVISKTDTHRYDKTTWGYINDLFTSMEVYEESNNNVQSCIESIILYNVIRSEKVPEIIEKKFDFTTFKCSQRNLNQDEKEKLFDYLYNYLTSKYNKCETSSERGFTKAVRILQNILRLLTDWGRDSPDYQFVIKNIQELIQVKLNHSWTEELSQLYNMSKTCKRLLFKESLLLNPTEEACINVLKHDPRLLELSKKDIENIYLNETLILKRLLNKIRVYWSQTLAQQIKEMYLDKIKNKTNHKSVVLGLCLLLPSKELLEFVQKYAPLSDKINWNQTNETELVIQRVIAKRLYLARPQPPLDIALLYAKGDYLQYALPSLNALLYNMNSFQSREQIQFFLNAPVSLQKHGIRVIATKLKGVETKEIFGNIWNSTRNGIIRADLFKQTFKLLCNEKNSPAAVEIWDLLSKFIDNLTSEENRSIYLTLSYSHMVPHPIKVLYWTKSYKFLKALPEKANTSDLCQSLKKKMNEILEFLDVEDAAEIFSKTFDENYSDDASYVGQYMLSSRNEDDQNIRFRKVLLPLLETALSCWDSQTTSKHCIRFEAIELLRNFSRNFRENVIDTNMTMPTALFSDILKKLEADLPKQENYNILTTLKITLSFIKILNSFMESYKNNATDDDLYGKNRKYWDLLLSRATPELADICIKYLRNDVKELFPSIYLLFSEVLYTLFYNFEVNDINLLKILQIFSQHDDFIEAQLLIYEMLPNYLDDREKALKMEILNKLGNHPSDEVKAYHWRYLERQYKRL